MMAYLVKPGVVHQISLVSIMSRTSIALISTPLTHCHQFLTYFPMRLTSAPLLQVFNLIRFALHLLAPVLAQTKNGPRPKP